MSDDDLEARVSELEAALRDLRAELERPPRPPTGPFGLPRPPTPREVAEFTRDAAIPAAIATLEAQIRVLETVQSALRYASPPDVDRADARDRAESMSRDALSRIDRTLSRLADEIEDGRLPQNEEARELLIDARELTDELRAEVDDAEESRTNIEVTAGDESEGLADVENAAAAQRVEDELDEIREKQSKRDSQTGRKR